MFGGKIQVFGFQGRKESLQSILFQTERNGSYGSKFGASEKFRSLFVGNMVAIVYTDGSKIDCGVGTGRRPY